MKNWIPQENFSDATFLRIVEGTEQTELEKALMFRLHRTVYGEKSDGLSGMSREALEERVEELETENDELREDNEWLNSSLADLELENGCLMNQIEDMRHAN